MECPFNQPDGDRDLEELLASGRPFAIAEFKAVLGPYCRAGPLVAIEAARLRQSLADLFERIGAQEPVRGRVEVKVKSVASTHEQVPGSLYVVAGFVLQSAFSAQETSRPDMEAASSFVLDALGPTRRPKIRLTLEDGSVMGEK